MSTSSRRPPLASSSANRTGRGATAFNGFGSRRGSPLDPLIDQLRLICEGRLSDEVFKGQRTVEGNRELQSGERRATEIEEGIPPADLLLGDSEHLGPHSREPSLRRSTWSLVVLLCDIEL